MVIRLILPSGMDLDMSSRRCRTSDAERDIRGEVERRLAQVFPPKLTWYDDSANFNSRRINLLVNQELCTAHLDSFAYTTIY